MKVMVPVNFSETLTSKLKLTLNRGTLLNARKGCDGYGKITIPSCGLSIFLQKKPNIPKSMA